MRAIRLGVAAWFIGGLGLSAVPAHADVSTLIEGVWEIFGQPSVDDNVCFIDLNPHVVSGATTVQVDGTVSGVGTAGQIVRIAYNTPQATSMSRDSAKAAIKQSRFATLNVSFDGLSATGDVIVQDCSINGSVNTRMMTGSTSVKCKGPNLLAILNAGQILSLQTAFSGRRDTNLKVSRDASKWSLSIKCNGAAAPD